MCDKENYKQAPKNRDGITQTDYSQDEENVTREENNSPNRNIVHLNRNNSRKRILEDISHESNKAPKLDHISFSNSDCQRSKNKNSAKSFPVINSPAHLTPTVKYYILNETGQLVTGHCLDGISDYPQSIPQHHQSTPFSNHDSQDANQSRLSLEQHLEDEEQSSLEQFSIDGSSASKKSASCIHGQQQSLDLSLKPGLTNTLETCSPVKKEKRVTIMTMTQAMSADGSPVQVLPTIITPPSASPNEKNNWYILPQVYQNKYMSTPETIHGNADDNTAILSRPTSVQSTCLSGQQGSYVYTPHPKSGQLFYLSTNSDGSPQLAVGTSYQAPVTPDTITKANVCHGVTSLSQLRSGVLTLNSSGDDNITSPTDDKLSLNAENFMSKRPRYDLLNSPELHDDEPRETHNLKERRRRARIKEACDLMRSLIPGMSEKTDKATVFEFAARYIHFLKTYTGSQYDKDFLVKYSPY